MIAKWTIKLASHDGVSRMANFSQTCPSHFLKSNGFRLSRASDSWSGAGDFGAGGWLLKAGGWLLKAGAAWRDGAASGGRGVIDRLGTLVTAGGNANGAEGALACVGAVACAGEIGGAGEIAGVGAIACAGAIGGAMGGIDLESEVFCDTLEPQRIDGPQNRRKI
jgi:hypothetical protein